MNLILMMSAKLATSGLCEIKIFRNEGYDAIVFVHDLTKSLSHDSDYTAVVFM